MTKPKSFRLNRYAPPQLASLTTQRQTCLNGTAASPDFQCIAGPNPNTTCTNGEQASKTLSAACQNGYHAYSKTFACYDGTGAFGAQQPCENGAYALDPDPYGCCVGTGPL